MMHSRHGAVWGPHAAGLLLQAPLSPVAGSCAVVGIKRTHVPLFSLCACARVLCGAQGLVAVDQACMGDLPRIHEAMLRVKERHPPTFT